MWNNYLYYLYINLLTMFSSNIEKKISSKKASHSIVKVFHSSNSKSSEGCESFGEWIDCSGWLVGGSIILLQVFSSLVVVPQMLQYLLPDDRRMKSPWGGSQHCRVFCSLKLCSSHKQWDIWTKYSLLFPCRRWQVWEGELALVNLKRRWRCYWTSCLGRGCWIAIDWAHCHAK